MGDRALLAAIIEPRKAPDVREFRPEVDAPTALILARMLKDEPADRFESTAALVQALGLVQGHPASPVPTAAVAAAAPPAALTPPIPPQAPITASRPRAPGKSTWFWKAAAIASVALLSGFAAYQWQASLRHARTPLRQLIRSRSRWRPWTQRRRLLKSTRCIAKRGPSTCWAATCSRAGAMRKRPGPWISSSRRQVC